MTSLWPSRLRLVRNPTPLSTALYNLCKVAGKRGPERRNLLGGQELRVTGTGVEDLIWGCGKEAPGGLDAARVGVVEAGDEDGGFAFWVELPVDEAFGEEHAGVVGEGGFDLRVWADDGGCAADDVAEA